MFEITLKMILSPCNTCHEPMIIVNGEIISDRVTVWTAIDESRSVRQLRHYIRTHSEVCSAA